MVAEGVPNFDSRLFMPDRWSGTEFYWFLEIPAFRALNWPDFAAYILYRTYQYI